MKTIKMWAILDSYNNIAYQSKSIKNIWKYTLTGSLVSIMTNYHKTWKMKQINVSEYYKNELTGLYEYGPVEIH